MENYGYTSSDCNPVQFFELLFQIFNGAAGPKFVAQTATPMRKNESQLLAWLAEPQSFEVKFRTDGSWTPKTPRVLDFPGSKKQVSNKPLLWAEMGRPWQLRLWFKNSRKRLVFSGTLWCQPMFSLEQLGCWSLVCVTLVVNGLKDKICCWELLRLGSRIPVHFQWTRGIGWWLHRAWFPCSLS